MKKNNENGLMMEEVTVKNLQEITGGAILTNIPKTFIPITTGAFHPILWALLPLSSQKPIIDPSFIIGTSN